MKESSAAITLTAAGCRSQKPMGRAGRQLSTTGPCALVHPGRLCLIRGAVLCSCRRSLPPTPALLEMDQEGGHGDQHYGSPTHTPLFTSIVPETVSSSLPSHHHPLLVPDSHCPEYAPGTLPAPCHLCGKITPASRVWKLPAACGHPSSYMGPPYRLPVLVWGRKLRSSQHI